MPTDSSGPIAWLAAMLTVVLALSSSLAVYAHNLFWAHMIVHLLMIMVVPVLLVWAQPIRLAHTAGEPASASRCRYRRYPAQALRTSSRATPGSSRREPRRGPPGQHRRTGTSAATTTCTYSPVGERSQCTTAGQCTDRSSTASARTNPMPHSQPMTNRAVPLPTPLCCPVCRCGGPGAGRP